MLSLDPGTLIAGRYRIESSLGRGGMGSVYRVVDQDRRTLALKLMSPRAGASLEMFEREYQQLAQLAHPRIISVFDYGVDRQGAFYTMELLGGQDLGDLGRVEWHRACELLRDVASSLAILHSRRLLHCDVSARNVRCTSDGRAKLIDFGALRVMGVSRSVVGTPPYVAPEMLHSQELDARTDLFSFGALAYQLLTGRVAYPARTLNELRAVWGGSPTPPAMLEPSVPAALSELVMECLALKREARPPSAGAVMERLCGIAGLPFEEGQSVQAYLTTPNLVGRDELLATVRAALLPSAARGAVFAANGPPGSGRSRFLSACVLEAKLLGWHALRADAGDASRGEYGAVRALCEQLFAAAPDPCARAARLHGPVLAHALGPRLAGCAPSERAPARKELLSSLRDFLLTVTRSLRAMIAIDDADRIDETSLGLLLALAGHTQHRTLCIALTRDPDADLRNATLDALCEHAHHVQLVALDQAQVEQLVSSVFGQGAHVATVGRYLKRVTDGRPGALMQLLDHLVTQGVARYEAGTFTLPERLDERELPRSLAMTLQRRVAQLDPDALELARALALTDPRALTFAKFSELTSHGHRTRTFAALDRLVREQILEPEGEYYRFRSDAYRGAVSEGLASGERVTLHARLARVFESFGGNARRALHLMESDQPRAAVDVLLAQYLKDPNEPRDPLEDYVPGILDLLERAARAALELELPAALHVELEMKTLGASQFLGDITRFARLAPPLAAKLTRESGLSDYHALSPDLAAAERLRLALSAAQHRYDTAEPSARGLPVSDAIRELSRLCAMHAGATAIAVDVSLLDQSPSLAPFAPLSPAVAAIHCYLESVRALYEGRTGRARELGMELLARLEQPDHAGLGELYYRSIKAGLHYRTALTDATEGLPSAATQLVELEHLDGYRVNAYRAQQICMLMQCDFEAAAQARRRAERAMLHDGAQQRWPGTIERAEVEVYADLEDLQALKQVGARLAKLAHTCPGWEPLRLLAQCHIRRLQGDAASALASIEAALAMAQPLRYRDYGLLAGAHVYCLTDLGRSDEAVAHAQRYRALCSAQGLSGGRSVATGLGLALLKAGRTEEAAAVADALVADLLANGVKGLVLGLGYELLARVAHAQRDLEAFEQSEQRCATEYRLDRHPTLARRQERLLRLADNLDDTYAPAVSASTRPPVAQTAAWTIRSRILEFTESEARAQCALRILAEHSEVEQAYLYGVRDGGLTLLGALPDTCPPDELVSFMQQYLTRQLTALESTDQATVAIDSVAPLSASAGELFDDRLHPLLIQTRCDGDLVIAGVAACGCGDRPWRAPPYAVLEAIGAALLEHDDVDALTCFA